MSKIKFSFPLNIIISNKYLDYEFFFAKASFKNIS